MPGAGNLTIGITIAPASDSNALLGANGLSQNIVYLAMLLRRLTITADIGLICNAEPHAVARHFGLPVWSVADASERCDVVIEFGARSFGAPEVERLRKRGGKLVSYVAGNVMAFNFEALAHGRHSGDQIVEHGFDATWLLPQHWHMCRSYQEMICSDEVHQIPPIWDPVVLNGMSAVLGKNNFWRPPADGRFTIGCFDPNVNVLKTFHLPLLVTEEAYRIDPAPIEKLLLFSALRFTASRHVSEMITATDIGRDRKVSLEDRHWLAHVMGHPVQAVVTHQWENKINYLYYEILYLGWPLIHNAPDLMDVGYYYNDFDPQDGGRRLAQALKEHGDTRLRQREAIRETLWGVSIDDPDVQERYSALLESVMA